MSNEQSVKNVTDIDSSDSVHDDVEVTATVSVLSDVTLSENGRGSRKRNITLEEDELLMQPRIKREPPVCNLENIFGVRGNIEKDIQVPNEADIEERHSVICDEVEDPEMLLLDDETNNDDGSDSGERLVKLREDVDILCNETMRSESSIKVFMVENNVDKSGGSTNGQARAEVRAGRVLRENQNKTITDYFSKKSSCEKNYGSSSFPDVSAHHSDGSLSACSPSKAASSEPEEKLSASLQRRSLPITISSQPTNFSAEDDEDSALPISLRNYLGEDGMWHSMDFTVKEYARDRNMFDRHPQLKPGMRLLFVSYLMQGPGKCFELHRETIYKAIDYVDRFLGKTSNVDSDCLQLVVVTALFIAAKHEEVYPPKLAEFVEYFEGAVTADQIRDMEVVVLDALNWCLNTTTPQNWLGLFMRLKAENDFDQCKEARWCVKRVGPDGERIFPQIAYSEKRFPRQDFANLVQVLDLCMLHLDSISFSYGSLAAAVFAFAFGRNKYTEDLTSFTMNELEGALEFIEPFALIFEKHRSAGDPFPNNGASWDDMCNFQMVGVNFDIDDIERELICAKLELTKMKMEKASHQLDCSRAHAAPKKSEAGPKDC